MIGRYYMRPEVALQLLVMSVTYRAFRKMGYDIKAAQELSAIHVRQK